MYTTFRPSNYGSWSRTCVKYRCHVPVSCTGVTYRCHVPVSRTGVTYRCHVPVSRTGVTYRCHVPVSRTGVTYRCHVPVSRTGVTYRCHVPVSRTGVTYWCQLLRFRWDNLAVDGRQVVSLVSVHGSSSLFDVSGIFTFLLCQFHTQVVRFTNYASK